MVESKMERSQNQQASYRIDSIYLTLQTQNYRKRKQIHDNARGATVTEHGGIFFQCWKHLNIGGGHITEYVDKTKVGRSYSTKNILTEKWEITFIFIYFCR